LRKLETTSKETENSRPIENCNKRQIKIELEIHRQNGIEVGFGARIQV
jgi:hypothetical protein